MRQPAGRPTLATLAPQKKRCGNDCTRYATANNDNPLSSRVHQQRGFMEYRDSFPEDVQRFILLGIPSVPYLEALLLMRGDPARTWTCPELARRLYLTEKAASTVLAELAAAGVTIRAVDGMAGVAHDAVRYAPQTPELQEMIDRLAETYPRHIVAVSELIHSRGRQSRAQQFADAFLLRKENP
jgi:hypothetical protein